MYINYIGYKVISAFRARDGPNLLWRILLFIYSYQIQVFNYCSYRMIRLDNKDCLYSWGCNAIQCIYRLGLNINKSSADVVSRGYLLKEEVLSS